MTEHDCESFVKLRNSEMCGGYCCFKDWRIAIFRGKYILWGGRNNIDIYYCPFCGKKLKEDYDLEN